MNHTVRFFHDFSSPFSYLGATQIEAFCARHGAELIWHPMLLGGVFKALGGPVIPLETFSEPKQRHASLDMQRWADHYGVPFAWPSRFPMRTITALRMVLALEDDDMPGSIRLSKRLHEAYWAEDADINDPDTLVGLANGCDIDGADLLARTQDPAVKQRLFDNTSRAVEMGVFGAPTYVVDESELFWGQDRLVLIEQLLSD